MGGESWPDARPSQAEWVVDILHQCQQRSIPFFFKQWGGVQKWRAGRLLLGKEYSEMPTFANDLPVLAPTFTSSRPKM